MEFSIDQSSRIKLIEFTWNETSAETKFSFFIFDF